MKKTLTTFVSVLLVIICMFAFASCSSSTMVDDGDGVKIATEVNVNPDYAALGSLASKSLKVGAIMVGDETEGYTEAHMNGINAAKAKIESLGGTVSITWKKKVGEDETCATEAASLAAAGNDIVITNSYGHQFQLANAVSSYPNTTFISVTGDMAKKNGANNYKNAFTNVYESRYVSGVVAGKKLKQLVDDKLLTDKNYDGDNIRIGYVGAFNYAEVVSGYTAFYLGLQSIVPNIVMHVQYTNSWFDYDKEYQTAKALIAEGCVIIGQHADSEGSPTACEEAYKAGTRVYSVGYNVDMLEAAPHAALTSSTNTWEVYYTYAFYTAMTAANGAKDISTDWAKGYKDGAVAITLINGKSFKADPSLEIKAVVDSIKEGTLKVFDCSKFKVDGANVTTTVNAADMAVWNSTTQTADACTTEYIKTAGGVTYFEESVAISAPSFAFRIDGITESGAN